MRFSPIHHPGRCLLVCGLVLVGCQAPDDATPTSNGPGASAAPPTTEMPGGTPTEAPAVAPSGDMPSVQAGSRDLLVAPQQPVTTTPGGDAEFALAGRLGEAESGVPPLAGFGWLPCAVVDATASGPLTFPDTDHDGHADRMGGSDTGSARLDTVNGEPFENVDDDWPTALHTRDRTPPLQLTMQASEPDCATVVLFLDEDDDEELDLDGDGVPTETYGVGEAVWE